MTRAAARHIVIAIVIACVLAAVIPAGIELGRRGWAGWTSVEQFHEHLSP
jgi:hypothetical protein